MSDHEKLDLVFGPGAGADAESRARGSEKMFVRSIDQLAEDSAAAKGHRLTAREALETYGFEKLLEVATEGSAALSDAPDTPGKRLRERRSILGLDTRVVAMRAKVTEQEVCACESSRRLPVKTYEKIASSIALDDRFIATATGPLDSNVQLAVRLRTIGDEQNSLGPSSVSALAEAAWVATTQARLEEGLGFSAHSFGLSENPSYGTPDYPAYRWGYYLAQMARTAIGRGKDEDIDSMRALVEERLGIPLIQCSLGERVAGATIQAGRRRAIVVNVDGANRSPYVRRATIAHELGHLLFDPPQRLAVLRVDPYDDLEHDPQQLPDPVEQRANAFAVEFLAPQEAAVDDFMLGGVEPLARIMDRFGVSFTAARYQVWNGTNRKVPLESINAKSRPFRPEWDARESFTIDFHPIRGLRVSRAGRFSAVVIRAAAEAMISWDTASCWLETGIAELKASQEGVKDLFPGVWGRQPN